MQAQVWCLHLLEHLRPEVVPGRDPASLPSYELDYRLAPRTFPTVHQADPNDPDCTVRTTDMAVDKRGVDHESYAYQLAVDLGAAARFTHVLKRHGWRAWWVWAMGSNFNTKLRMVGPFKMADEQLREVLEVELWNVCRRSGGLVCK